MESEVLSYFETQAKSGDWESLYNPQNPKSYPFIIRLQKTLNLLEDIDNKKICDLGCGTGFVGLSISKNSRLKNNYYFSDISPKAIQLCKKNAKKNNIKIEAKVGEILQPWKNKKFDIIVESVSGIAKNKSKNEKC